jgi:hypothetical protein
VKIRRPRGRVALLQPDMIAAGGEAGGRGRPDQSGASAHDRIRKLKGDCMSDALAIVTDDQRGSLEEIALRTLHIRSPSHDWTRGMPPHIERASASREKKPPPPPIAKPVAVPPFVPSTIELGGRVLAILGDYTGMQTASRTRVDEFGITREQLDFLSGNIKAGIPERFWAQSRLRNLASNHWEAQLAGSAAILHW